jgi:hypothetical protein
MPENQPSANMPSSSAGNQGDNTAPAGIESPGTFVPLDRTPHTCESTNPPAKGGSGKE